LLFRTIFENATDSLFLFSLDEHGCPRPFREVNPGAYLRLGYTEAELSRMTLSDIVSPGSIDLPAFYAELRGQTTVVKEMRFVAANGKHFDDEVSARLFALGERRVVLAIGRDITQRKIEEATLLAAKSESDLLAEMRATFLANMSHEIRTPLTSIIGVSQLLGQHELSERQRVMVHLIQTSGRRLQQTLDSVLDISRIEAGEMTPRYEAISLVTEIEEDIAMLRPMAERRGLSLELDVDMNDDLFWTDIGFLHRIVYNLVENAIKFTDAGYVHIHLGRPNGAVELIVEDTGIGIAADFLPYLFDKFKQASVGTNRRYDGTGLGMALVKHLVDLLGGTIFVDSTPGQGTKFTVTIPEHRPHTPGPFVEKT
jgi:PAS domain S-box-containing protein